MKEQELKEETINRGVDYLLNVVKLTDNPEIFIKKQLEAVWQIAFASGRLDMIQEINKSGK